MSLSKSAIIFGIAVTSSVSALIFYLFNKKKEETVKDSDDLGWIKHTIKVPQEAVGLIIGREGGTIRSIRAQTGAKIFFSREDGDNDRYLMIYGSEESVLEAEILINNLIRDAANIISELITIPNRLKGKLIGQDGDNIKNIAQLSKAIIDIKDAQNEKDPEERIKIFLKGTREQVCTAFKLIEKIQEEDVNSRETKGLMNTPYLSDRCLPSSASSSVNYNTPFGNILKENLGDPILDKVEYIEVFMSTAQSPDHFLLQYSNSKAKDLDKLVEEMTAFYDEEEKKDSSLLIKSHFNVGDMCAAKFTDNKWYRALVTEQIVDDYSGELSLNLFYVDFGDGIETNINSIYTLLPQFQVLPHQGIVCSLDKVEPIDGNGWSNEAIDYFEKVTFTSQWVPISARVMQVKNGKTFVELVVNQNDETLHVGTGLVENGFARFKSEN